MTISTRYDVSFKGAIVTEQPYHSTTTDPRKDQEPLRLPRHPMGHHMVPVIPSAGIRGRLRRHAFKFLTNALIRKAGLPDDTSPFTLHDYYLNATGGFSEKGNGHIKMRADRERNPITSLFGSAFQWNESRVYMGIGMPADPENTNVFVIKGVRRDDLLRSASGETADFKLGKSVYEEFLVRQAMAKADTARTKEIATLTGTGRGKKGKQKELTEEEKVRVQELKAQTPGDRTVSGQMMVAGFEAVPTGTVFNHRMDMIGVTGAEIGFFLKILKEFSRRPWLGAKQAVGCGGVRAYWDFKITEVDTWNDVAEGRIALGGEDKVFDCPDVLAPFIDEWELFLAGASVDDMRASEVIAAAVDEVTEQTSGDADFDEKGDRDE